MSKVKIVAEEIFSRGCFDRPGAKRNTAVAIRYIDPDDGDLLQDLKNTLLREDGFRYNQKAEVWLTNDPRMLKAAELIAAL